ncbi:MAG: DnaJ domain-containing protein [Deltaproteobacteria bacterium]|nr:DnaJ domain-containing protein [Deltaproteobacteria bacterium]
MVDFVEGLGKLGDPVKIVSGVDILSLALTVQQGFVLSRVDGVSSAQMLCQISGLGEAATLEILKGLRAGGLIIVGDEDPPRVSKPAEVREEASPEEASPAEALNDIELPPIISRAADSAPTRSQEMRALEDLDITAEDEAELDKEDDEGEIDLRREIRVRVRALHARIDDLNFFELLGVDVNGDTREVRRAYFKRSKQFHPDRFFSKKCGHYEEKLARIFKQTTSAYEFLQQDDKRAEYQEMILREREELHIAEKLAKEVAQVEGMATPNDTPSQGELRAEAEQSKIASTGTATSYSYVKVGKSERVARQRRATAALGTPVFNKDDQLPVVVGAGSSAEFEPNVGHRDVTPDEAIPAVGEGSRPESSGENALLTGEYVAPPTDDDARAARRTLDRRRRRRMTGLGAIDERQGKAKGFYEKGMKQLDEGKTLAAAASLKLALTYDPSTPEYQQRYDEAVDASREVTAEGFYKRALFEESVGRVEAAAKLFLRAAEILDSALYLTRACEAARELEDLEKALEYGTHAVQKEPGSVAARLAISRACLACGDKKRARHEVDMALKLAPADAEAKDLLKRIKRA